MTHVEEYRSRNVQMHRHSVEHTPSYIAEAFKCTRAQLKPRCARTIILWKRARAGVADREGKCRGLFVSVFTWCAAWHPCGNIPRTSQRDPISSIEMAPKKWRRRCFTAINFGFFTTSVHNFHVLPACCAGVRRIGIDATTRSRRGAGVVRSKNDASR